MVPVQHCQVPFILGSDQPCDSPGLFAEDFPGLRISGETDLEGKVASFLGMRFQYSYGITSPQDISSILYQIEIRSALVLLSTDLSGAPAYIPNLFTSAFSETDEMPAGTVLWRGQDWIVASGSIAYASTSGVNNALGGSGKMVEVKTRRRINKEQRLFWIGEAVNNTGDSYTIAWSFFGVAAMKKFP